MKISKCKLIFSTTLLAIIADCGYLSHAKNPAQLEEDAHALLRMSHSSKMLDDENIATLKSATAKPSFALKNPLIEVTENGKKTSPILTKYQDTLLRMNDMSYNLCKGYLEFSVGEQEKLEKEGWKIKAFSGLEGRYNNFSDVAGVVCYHPQKNVITVVYHGTAGNKEGWETNFEGEKFESKKLQKEYRKDLYAQIEATLATVSNKANVQELEDFLQGIKSKEFSNANMLQVQGMAEKLKADGKISSELCDDIVHAVKIKLELLEYIEQTGCNIPGEIHKGFAKKYYTTKREVLGLLKEFIDIIPDDQKESVKIIFSGHSQAGGLGALAQADIGTNHNIDLFGDDKTNQSTGRYYGYFLSAARAGDKDFAKWMHNKIGKDYIVRQNVDGDPVPVVLGDKAVCDFVRAIPAVGEPLSKMADYDDVGHLLLDSHDDVWNRAQGLFKEAKVNVEELNNFEAAIYYVGNTLVGEDSVPGFIAKKQAASSWNPFSALWQINNARSYGMLLKDAKSGNKEAQQKLGLMLEQRYGHLHYGHYKEGVGATFDPNVVGRDLNKMLAHGDCHEKAKAEKEAQAKTEQYQALVKQEQEAAAKKQAIADKRREAAEKKKATAQKELAVIQGIATEAN